MGKMVLGNFQKGISQGRLQQPIPKGQVRPSEVLQAVMGAKCSGNDCLGGRALWLVLTW